VSGHILTAVTSSTDLSVRRLGPADLPRCLALAQDRDWSREERKWALLLELGGVYGIEDDAGDLLGTTVLTRYGDQVAAIGMVLVASRVGGQGFGRRLMTHALRQARGGTVSLYATAYGRPLYEKLGFRVVSDVVTQIGDYQPAPGDPRSQVSRPAVAADLPAIGRMDAEVFGADRTFLLRRLFSFAEQVRILRREGVMCGYAGAWRNIETTVVGPVVARNDADARALIADLAAEVSGPIRLDLDDRHRQLWNWAADRGVTAQFHTTLMVHGAPLPGQPEHYYIPVMQALG
jgi:GNAT superfamily N-acetyltransferase